MRNHSQRLNENFNKLGNKMQKKRVRINIGWHRDPIKVINYSNNMNREFNVLLNSFYKNISKEIVFIENEQDSNIDWTINLGLIRVQPITPPERTVVFETEPTHTAASLRRNTTNYSKYVVAQKKELFNNHQNVIETRNLSIGLWHKSNCPNKIKDISAVISSTGLKLPSTRKKISKKMKLFLRNKGKASEPFYKYRIQLVSELANSSIPIDIYGRGWDKNLSNNIKGGLENKFDGLEKYRFSLAIENCSETNYITEKFSDLLQCDTIPIYYGCPNIEDYYDKRGFIILEDIKDIDLCKKQLKEISLDAGYIYNKMLPYLKINKNRFLNRFFWIVQIYEIIKLYGQ